MVTEMTSSRMVLGLLLSLAFASAAGCDDHHGIVVPEAGMYDTGPGVDVGMEFSDTGIGFSELSILRVVPDHGPFTGGNVAVLRGAGFTADATVTFGTHEVQGADHTLIDARRLQVVVPAGAVGVVDVSVRVGANTFTLPHGYTYDALSVDPDRGSVAGGTFVNIVGSGTHFANGDTVLFGRSPALDVTVVSPERITCRTPPQSAGTVDVTVVSAADSSMLTAVQAYDYYDTSDPVSGGLGGGPTHGTINVTAIDSASGMPVPGAFVIVGEDLSTMYQGLTDSMGQISFSGPDLVGQHTVHISKHCYERTSFVAFDAQDVTAFLVPWEDPMCGMGMGSTGGRGRNAAFIEGDLVFPTSIEYGPVPWDIIPHPPAGCTGLGTEALCTADAHDACIWSGSLCSTAWIRVGYVYTTQLNVYQNSGLGVDDSPNPDPSLGGATPRVLSASTPPDGHGFPYRILARPAGLAVYALAGLENTTTGVFIPYVMGVTRNVLVGPGEDVTGVDILMNLPLDHSLVADLGTLPAQAHGEPDRFYMRAVLDLGGEGVIVRNMPGHTDPSSSPPRDYDFDTIRRRDANHEFRFVAEPALEGTIADGRFEIIAGYTAAYESRPYTVVLPRGITAVDEHVQLPAFLGVPDAVSPANGGRIPADRTLRWQEPGGAPADFHLILMVGQDGNPAWRMFVRGDQTSAPIPDLSSIPMVDDITPGEAQWAVFSISIPGFDFDTLSYNEINEGYWSAYSVNQFAMEL